MLNAAVFSTADEQLTRGNYLEAEDSYAKLLRGAVQEENLSLRADCLQSLGDVYIEKAQDKRFQIRDRVNDLTKAVALYNAAVAMIREADETDRIQVLSHRIQLVEKVFLKCVGSKTTTPPSTQLERDHKLQLKEIRETAFQRLMECEREYCSFDENPMENAEVMGKEYSWALKVHQLYKEIAGNIKDFIRGLVNECIEALEQPPCEYAIIGLGSLAREETTPFSDFEFAILVEEGKDTARVKGYFRNLTNLLHIKVINLGETILPAMSIRSLNDHASGDVERDWYYDSVTPRGFAFDGAMPWASKTPLGRAATKDMPALELILTPSQMAAIQEEDRAVKEGYHLADVLAKVTHVAGSLALVEEYQKMVRDTILSSIYGKNVHLTTVEEGASTSSKDVEVEQNRHWKALMSGLNMTTQEGIYLGLLKVGHSYEVKKEIYRFPTAIISTLGICCGVFENSSWDIVEGLRRSGVITESAAHNLKIAVCLALALRLRRYMASGAQRDAMTVTPSFVLRSDADLDTSDVLSTFNLEDTNTLSRFYHTALPLQMVLSKVRKSGDPNVMKSNLIELLEDQSLYDDINLTRGLIHLRFGQYEEAEAALRQAVEDEDHADDVAVHSYVLSLRYQDKHQEALAILLNHEESNTQSPLSRALLTLTLSHSFLSTGQEIEAQQCLEQHLGDLPDTSESVATLLNTAVLANRRGDYTKSIEYCLQARRTLVGLREGLSSELSLTVENNLGASLTNAGMFTEALDCFQKVWAILRRMYGPNVAHPKYLPILENMSSVYTRMGHHPKAMALAEEGLRMARTLYGDDENHLTVSNWIGVLAYTLWKAKELKRAASFARKDLEISKSIFGPGAHSRIVQATIILASCLGELGDLEPSEKLLKQAVEMANHLKDPKLFSDASFHMGVVYTTKKDYKRAIEYFEKALELRRSSKKDAYDIAAILSSLGYAYFLQEEPTTALRYLQEALDILRKYSPTALTGTTVAAIGNVFHMLGDLGEAIAHYEQARSLFEAIYGPRPSEDFAELLISLAGTLLKQGNSEDAIHRGAEGIRMMRDIYGEDSGHPNIVLGLYIVATALFNVGFPEEAVKYGEEAKKLSSQQQK